MEVYWMRIHLPTGPKDVSCLAESLDQAEQIFIANLDSGDYDYLLDGHEDYTANIINPNQEEFLV